MINNTSTQGLHCLPSGSIFVLPFLVDNWVSFVLLSAARPYLSPIASDLVIWRWDVLWSPELASVALQRNSLCFYVSNGAIHYVPPELGGHLALKSKKVSTSTSISKEQQKKKNKKRVCHCMKCNIQYMGYHSTVICAVIIHAFTKLPRLALCVFDE